MSRSSSSGSGSYTKGFSRALRPRAFHVNVVGGRKSRNGSAQPCRDGIFSALAKLPTLAYMEVSTFSTHKSRSTTQYPVQSTPDWVSRKETLVAHHLNSSTRNYILYTPIETRTVRTPKSKLSAGQYQGVVRQAVVSRNLDQKLYSELTYLSPFQPYSAMELTALFHFLTCLVLSVDMFCHLVFQAPAWHFRSGQIMVCYAIAARINSVALQ